MPILKSDLAVESRDKFLTYALSVISGRALPDARDGLKPVQRRILFTMYRNLGLKPGGSHRKSATVIGAVLGSFHPHSDQACYEAMVRMAQDFSLRYPLIDGQGNFGSIDGDPAAAYRYTEVKLTPLALEVIGELDQETVEFRDNFDATQLEPVVFPSRAPNLLINGCSGIAVGMATSIPPHNLKDVVKALVELLDNPEISSTKLAGVLKGPDFPTGCLILNSRQDLNEIYSTGKGAIKMRAEWKVAEGARGKKHIIISSLPYTVNKKELVEKIGILIAERKIPQLNDIRDVSTTDVCVQLELTTGADPKAAMAYLFKHTLLETQFSVNLTALVPIEKESEVLKPQLLDLKRMLSCFLDFRIDVVKKKLTFEKKQLLARAHILEGLVKIFDALDQVIKIVRSSEGRGDAAAKLRTRFKLSEEQAFAVVDMRIYQLAKTNIAEIKKELKEKKERLAQIDKILGSNKKIKEIVREDLIEIGETYGDKRRCQIQNESENQFEYREEDYLVNEEVYAIITRDGWLKRIRATNELNSTRLREGDAILAAHKASTLDLVVFITNLGSLFTLKINEFPASSGYGEPVQKILKFKDGEKIIVSFIVQSSNEALAVNNGAVILNSDQLAVGEKLFLVSKNGTGFILKISELKEVKRIGKKIMKLREGDQLAAVSKFGKNIALFTKEGYALAFNSKEIPEKDSAVVGVSLIGVRDNDTLVAAYGWQEREAFLIIDDDQKKRQIEADEIVFGRRSLKGNKIIARGKIAAVFKKRDEPEGALNSGVKDGSAKNQRDTREQLKLI
ncbi:MAG TPA: DNA topoisomerase 4 subunit A [Oligoflexia bacterium]|nr:DNA topoisomerase 4 subunit A [Oligoflexia bacterium]HMP26801.1 DNA topoisomerase 4 subunit A [Oligoflexia bacterium]